MRVLLLGSTGLVGRHLRAAFRDDELFATSRTGAEGTSHLDVTDRTALAAMMRDVTPAVVVNAAAEAHVERCEAEPARTRATNVEAAASVAELAAAAGAAYVAFSSEYVFDGSAGTYSEDHPVAPLNEYGRQKVDLESIVRSVPRGLVLRTSGVFGWEPRRKNFVCQLIDALRAGRRFAVPSDQLITPTYAPSLAAAVRELLALEVSGTLHLVGPRVLARMDFARAVAAAFALPQELLDPVPTHDLWLRAVRPRAAGLRDERLLATLGHGLQPPEEALREMRAAEVR